MSAITVKIRSSAGDDVRRTRIARDAPFSAVQAAAQEAFGATGHLTWADEDGDNVSVRGNADWGEAVGAFDGGVVKLSFTPTTTTTTTATATATASAGTGAAPEAAVVSDAAMFEHIMDGGSDDAAPAAVSASTGTGTGTGTSTGTAAAAVNEHALSAEPVIVRLDQEVAVAKRDLHQAAFEVGVVKSNEFEAARQAILRPATSDAVASRTGDGNAGSTHTATSDGNNGSAGPSKVAAAAAAADSGGRAAPPSAPASYHQPPPATPEPPAGAPSTDDKPDGNEDEDAAGEPASVFAELFRHIAKHIKKEEERRASEPPVHHGVECDASGETPMRGTRYHLIHYNYDINEAEFNKLPAEQQALFEAIARPGAEPVPVGTTTLPLVKAMLATHTAARFDRARKEREARRKEEEKTAQAPHYAQIPAGDVIPPFKAAYGSRGPGVAQLQHALIAVGAMDPAAIQWRSGVFGPRTTEAVRGYKAKHGIESAPYNGGTYDEAVYDRLVEEIDELVNSDGADAKKEEHAVLNKGE